MSYRMIYCKFLMLTCYVCALFVHSGSAISGNVDSEATISIIWNIIGFQPMEYDASVHIINDDPYGSRPDPWKVSWAWLGDEMIREIYGAMVTEQGECPIIIGDIVPRSCVKSPEIVDLVYMARSNRWLNCCKSGYLSSPLQDSYQSSAAFLMVVTNPSRRLDLSYMRVPDNFSLGLPNYKCGSPLRITPPNYGRRQHTQALKSWRVTCQYLQPTTPNCCVLVSVHNDPVVLGCPEDTCASPDKSDVQELSSTESAPHLCPISIHWQMFEVFGNFWWVRVTLKNYNLNNKVSDWNMVIQYPNITSVVKADNFKYASIPSENQSDNFLFWPNARHRTIHPQQERVSFIKLRRHSRGRFRLTGRLIFPRAVYFNGQKCAIPHTLNLPELPAHHFFQDYHTMIFKLTMFIVFVLMFPMWYDIFTNP